MNNSKIEEYINDIKGEEVAFENNKKDRKLIKTRKENVRKRKDGYYNVKVPFKNGNRFAIVPKDTLLRLVQEGTSFRPLKDRYNTLSALTNTFDKPLYYYAIVAYDKVPKEEYEKWDNSSYLLPYELVHLNGNLDDIREENIRLTFKDENLWEKIRDEYKSQNKIGADLEYARRREETIKKQFKDYPDLKIMVRVIDPVKKHKKSDKQKYNPNEVR
ncbi:MAG: hypothetical protein IJH39_01795 [Clostridia bacterium]|nr:hypothetical protein [Clostridia bacterium]